MNRLAVPALWLCLCLALSGCSIQINPASPPANGPASASTGSKIPVTWGSLNLSGRLVYISAVTQETSILIKVQSLDLSTGSVTTIFAAPDGGWIDSVAVAPDLQQMVLAYSPPGNAGSPRALEAFYSMPLDGSQLPRLLFAPPSDQDQYYQPEWSPDGHYLYFAHVDFQAASPYEVLRVLYPGGVPEKLADHAYWPRLSNDGTHLAYVSLDPDTGINKLFLAQADGSAPQQVVLTGPAIPNVIDAPMFSADDGTIIFSAPDPGQASAPDWLERFMGIGVAHADGTLPSDWWWVPIAGGTPKQLTHTRSLALFATYSPDQKYLASFSADGIFVMKPNGKALTQIVKSVGGISGTVDWLP